MHYALELELELDSAVSNKLFITLLGTSLLGMLAMLLSECFPWSCNFSPFLPKLVLEVSIAH